MRAHSRPTLFDPMDSSPPGFSVHGISRQEYWSGLTCPPPGDFPDPGITPTSRASPALAGGFFTTSDIWEALGIRSRNYQNIRINLVSVNITLDGRDEE